MPIPARRLMADVSNNNPGFDARAYHAAGHRAVAIKATEGVGGHQITHGPWTDAAHHAGLRVIHYHFARPDTHATPAGEALDFLAAVEPHWRRGDRVCLDLEVAPIVAGDADRYVRGFARAMRQRRGRVGSRHAWLYTGTFYFREHGLRLPAGWRLWLADYAVPVLGARPGVARVWAHQFTDGRNGPLPHGVAGVAGPCDVSALSRRAAVGLHLHLR